jgi:hypothetical protein
VEGFCGNGRRFGLSILRILARSVLRLYNQLFESNNKTCVSNICFLIDLSLLYTPDRIHEDAEVIPLLSKYHANQALA